MMTTMSAARWGRARQSIHPLRKGDGPCRQVPCLQGPYSWFDLCSGDQPVRAGSAASGPGSAAGSWAVGRRAGAGSGSGAWLARRWKAIAAVIAPRAATVKITQYAAWKAFTAPATRPTLPAREMRTVDTTAIAMAPAISRIVSRSPDATPVSAGATPDSAPICTAGALTPPAQAGQQQRRQQAGGVLPADRDAGEQQRGDR